MYFITTLYIKKGKVIRKRTVGYFSDFKKTKIILRTDGYDLYECGYYNFVVVENIPEGIYQGDTEPTWFKYDKKQKGFFECIAPRLTGSLDGNGQIYSFSIG